MTDLEKAKKKIRALKNHEIKFNVLNVDQEAIIKSFQDIITRLERIEKKEFPAPAKEVKAEITNLPVPQKKIEAEITNFPEVIKEVKVSNFPEAQEIKIPEVKFPDIQRVKVEEEDSGSTKISRDRDGKIVSWTQELGGKSQSFSVKRDLRGRIIEISHA